MKYCRTCLMPDTRPRVRFDETGQCNGCRYAEERRQVNWAARKKQFIELLGRQDSEPWNVIVPCSGGKDSSRIAYELKYTYGMSPLAVCFGQYMWTPEGQHNLNRLCQAGIDVHYWRVNQQVMRYLARRFFRERGHPKNAYDSAVTAVPMRTALAFRIPLIVHAEHGESFYGGNVLSEEHRRVRSLDEVLENQVGDDARNWADHYVSEADLAPYILPEAEELKALGVEDVYWSWYHPWSIWENACWARDVLRFKPAQYGENGGWGWGKSDGSFEGFDSIDDMIDTLDFHLMYVKFGFGRATRMASRLIQLNLMTREQGLNLVRIWDSEPPHSFWEPICEYLGISRGELTEIIDSHRGEGLFELRSGVWTPTFEVS